MLGCHFACTHMVTTLPVYAFQVMSVKTASPTTQSVTLHVMVTILRISSIFKDPKIKHHVPGFFRHVEHYQM